MATRLGNQILSRKRSSEWRAKLVHGKLEARLDPTRLRMKRVNLCHSQLEIARSTGLSLATFGAIERGVRPVVEKNALKISQLLSCTTEELFKKSNGKLFARKNCESV